MENKQSLSPEQMDLNQKRLQILNAVQQARSERLQVLCNRFTQHFNNPDLMEVEFAEYQGTLKLFEKICGVVSTITPEEANAIMPHLQSRHQVAHRCLELAQQREKEKVKNTRFFLILSHIFGRNKKTQKTPVIPQKTR